MKNEQTVLFIKPEAAHFEVGIERSLRQLDGELEKWQVLLTEDTLRVIYPDLSALLLEATCRHLAGKIVTVFVVKGEGMIGKVVEHVGSQTEPESCEFNSLRYMYWAKAVNKHPELLEDGRTLYFYNFIHRAKNGVEAQTQIAVLRNRKIDEHK